jgi:DUF3102 family protein
MSIINRKQPRNFVAPETKPKANAATIDDFALRITAAWQKTTASIIETGCLLIEAKRQLQHGQWSAMVEEKLPFGQRTAQMLMEIGRSPILSNPQHVSFLPPSWGTLYKLTELPEQELEELIATGKITCETERSEVEEMLKRLREAGLYDFSNVRRVLSRLIKYKEKWPDHGPIIEQMWEPDDDDDYVDLKLLGELAPWIAELHAKCEELDRRREAERETVCEEMREQEGIGRSGPGGRVLRTKAAKTKHVADLRRGLYVTKGNAVCLV